MEVFRGSPKRYRKPVRVLASHRGTCQAFLLKIFQGVRKTAVLQTVDTEAEKGFPIRNETWKIPAQEFENRNILLKKQADA